MNIEQRALDAFYMKIGLATETEHIFRIIIMKFFLSFFSLHTHKIRITIDNSGAIWNEILAQFAIDSFDKNTDKLKHTFSFLVLLSNLVFEDGFFCFVLCVFFSFSNQDFEKNISKFPFIHRVSLIFQFGS